MIDPGDIFYLWHRRQWRRVDGLRRCEVCNGRGPCLMDPLSHRYSCIGCHSEPGDTFFLHEAGTVVEWPIHPNTAADAEREAKRIAASLDAQPPKTGLA